MKKSTVLILIIVYLGSIFIVGVYGLNPPPGNDIVYCESIVPDSIILSTGEVLSGDSIVKNTEDPSVIRYDVKISSKKYYDGLTVIISYKLSPDNCTCNGKTDAVKFFDVSPPNDGKLPAATITEDGKIKFSRKAQFDVQLKVQDQATGPEIVISFFFGR